MSQSLKTNWDNKMKKRMSPCRIGGVSSEKVGDSNGIELPSKTKLKKEKGRKKREIPREP